LFILLHIFRLIIFYLKLVAAKNSALSYFKFLLKLPDLVIRGKYQLKQIREKRWQIAKNLLVLLRSISNLA
jgi:hypothetical protein